jgi:tellurite methyltransferase
MTISEGGYDEGYRAVPCFWGTAPGSLVAEYLRRYPIGSSAHVLDLGCGEGKNAAAFTEAGYSVDAVDCSALALANGRKKFCRLDIRWIQADARQVRLPTQEYDVVISYGLFHCLQTLEEISLLMEKTKNATKKGGHHLVCVFNDRSQDLAGHPGFAPTLAPHEWYVRKYAGWEIISATDTILKERHPHNNILHHHSLTRLFARRPE